MFALRRAAASGIFFFSALVVPVSASAASAATSIASAPTIAYGEIETGGGPAHEFFRLFTFAGDQVTFRVDRATLDGSISPVFKLFDPSVDDYTIDAAQPLNDFDMHLGGLKQQFVWHVPFAGLGTIQVTGGNGQTVDSFSFIASVTHLTAFSEPRAPSSVGLRSSKFVITAIVNSPAGLPLGQCEFDRINPGQVTPFTTVPVAASPGIAGSICRTVVRPGPGRTSRYQIKFLPDTGWQSTTVTTAPVRVRRLPVSVSFARLPHSAQHPSSRLALAASVKGPDHSGTPSGDCTFFRLAARKPRRLGTVPTRAGRCRLTTIVGDGQFRRFMIRFHSNADWLDGSATSPTVRLG